MRKSLKITKGGVDGIHAKISKSIANFISNPLSHFTNLSFEKSVCPLHFKSANIISLYKSGDKIKLTK